MTHERAEPRRFLHKRSHHGYTERVSEAMANEPEAVSDEYQRQLTRRARDAERGRDTGRVREACAQINAALLVLDGVPTAVSHVRVMRRQLAQLTTRFKDS